MLEMIELADETWPRHGSQASMLMHEEISRTDAAGGGPQTAVCPALLQQGACIEMAGRSWRDGSSWRSGQGTSGRCRQERSQVKLLFLLVQLLESGALGVRESGFVEMAAYPCRETGVQIVVAPNVSKKTCG